MKKFDYSFLDNGLLPANLINLTGLIYSLKTGAEIRKDEYEKIFTELEKIAKVQSVKSSNEIEGIVTSDERIKQIVNQSSEPLNHNELEIAGYRDALNEIHLNYENIDFSEETILRLHEIMMFYTGNENSGKYKTDNNLIIEQDEEGKRKVRFKPVSRGVNYKAVNIKTQPYPGFATDLQQPIIPFLTTCQGISTVEETIYENRFQNIYDTNRMGASIIVKNNKIAKVKGPTKLYGKEVTATDLRGGASMLICGLLAEGTTTIDNVKYILRGYDSICEKLSKIGAKIELI